MDRYGRIAVGSPGNLNRAGAVTGGGGLWYTKRGAPEGREGGVKIWRQSFVDPGRQTNAIRNVRTCKKPDV